jgi:type I restriction enzyme R subunit
VSRYRDLDSAAQDAFKSRLMSFTRLYAFLSHIVSFQDADLETLYAYGRFLLLKLPRRDEAGTLDLGNDVALEYYRLSRTGAGSIALGGDAETLKGPTEVGTGGEHEPVKERLSTIISILNERFGTDFTQADQLAFDQIEEELVANEELAEQARVNSIDNYKYGFEDAFMDAVIDRKAQNEEIFTRILDDGDFASAVKAYLMQKVYERQNGSSP